MFADAPLTGTGPGSYRWSSVPVYPDDANLTSSAHNEYLQALGEQGLIGGVALLGSALGLAWLVLGVLRRPGEDAVEVAAAGGVTVLAAHAAIDFDHSYPLLLALLAVAGATLLHTRVLATATIERSDLVDHAPGDDPRADTRPSADTPPTPRWQVAGGDHRRTDPGAAGHLDDRARGRTRGRPAVGLRRPPHAGGGARPRRRCGGTR